MSSDPFTEDVADRIFSILSRPTLEGDDADSLESVTTTLAYLQASLRQRTREDISTELRRVVERVRALEEGVSSGHRDRLARAIYALLRLLGASTHDEEHFVSYIADLPTTEWRFQGSLGFGGKLYLEPDHWRVGCYREDDSHVRTATIECANVLLKRLRRSAKRV